MLAIAASSKMKETVVCLEICDWCLVAVQDYCSKFDKCGDVYSGV